MAIFLICFGFCDAALAQLCFTAPSGNTYCQQTTWVLVEQAVTAQQAPTAHQFNAGAMFAGSQQLMPRIVTLQQPSPRPSGRSTSPSGSFYSYPISNQNAASGHHPYIFRQDYGPFGFPGRIVQNLFHRPDTMGGGGFA